MTAEHASLAQTSAVPARSVIRAVLALGSNLGDREATIRAGIQDIASIDGVALRAASGLVESQAIKPSGVDAVAPSYLNAIVVVDSSLTPLQLLDAVNRIEDRHGRVRIERWGDRTLDIDLVSVDELIIQTERLTLPHPRAGERAFVLIPWLDIDPDAVLPGRGRVADLVSSVPDRVWPYQTESLMAVGG